MNNSMSFVVETDTYRSDLLCYLDHFISIGISNTSIEELISTNKLKTFSIFFQSVSDLLRARFSGNITVNGFMIFLNNQLFFTDGNSSILIYNAKDDMSLTSRKDWSLTSRFELDNNGFVICAYAKLK